MNTKGDGEMTYREDQKEERARRMKEVEANRLPYTSEELAKLCEEAAEDIDQHCLYTTPKSIQKWLDRAAALRGGK
ncbi:MAG: hypothetical protein WC710_13580 [Gallionella sp.]|jgi:hypothetical protein